MKNMKFEINSEVKLQVSFGTLKNTEGGKIHIYYFSGERYQHFAHWGGKGGGNISFWITDENGQDAGNVNVTAETPEEEKILNMYIHHSRDKETDQFLLIPLEMELR
jgi:hypothetical protein